MLLSSSSGNNLNDHSRQAGDRHGHGYGYGQEEGLDVSGLFDDDAWDIMGVNEQAEVSLVGEGAFKADVSRSSTFIRLLVRSVGLFGMENDTERLLLDGAKSRFKEVLRKLRDIAQIHKAKCYRYLLFFVIIKTDLCIHCVITPTHWLRLGGEDRLHRGGSGT